MKNIKIFALLLAVAMFVVSCDKPSNKKNENVIAKEWHIESWCNQTPEFDVYIAFSEDGTFSIYQQIFSLNYVRYSGTYTAANGVLTGVYEDGSVWDSTYDYTISADGSQLTLTSQGNAAEVSVYVNEVIPEAVKTEAANTRSVEVEPFL
jgi:hypothetical protein